jgi:hypothetical protein
MRRSYACFALLAFLALPVAAAPRAAPKVTARVAKPGATIDLHTLNFRSQIARTPVARDPAMSAYALMALRRFADGTRSNDPVDKAVARALGRVKNGRKIAKRIVARIDALPQAQRTKAFGGGDMTRSTLELAKSTTVGIVTPLFVAFGNTATDTLWAEPTEQQSSFKLGISGLAVQETSDGDQDGDEVVVMSTLATLDQNATDIVLKQNSAPETGALEGLNAGGVVPLDRQIFSGGAVNNGLLVTAAFEVDGDAADARDDYTAMVVLAKPLALQLFQQGDTPQQKLTRFAFALDYTVGLLAAGQPDRWPQGALVKTKMDQFGTSLAGLAAAPPSNDGGVAWKLAHTHDLPAGKYVVYFDVPSTAPPAQKKIKVKVTRIEALQPEQGGDDLTLRVAIGNDDAEKKLPDNTNLSTKTWTVERMVNPGTKTIELALSDFTPGPAYGYVDWYGSNQMCGDWGAQGSYAPCPAIVAAIDLDAVNDWMYDPDSFIAKLNVNTETGAITGEATGQVGTPLTVQGGMYPKGSVKITVTVE